MKEFHPEPLIEQLFKRIRKEFHLGMREYLAAIDAVRGDLGINDWDGLKEVLLLLWCHSRAEQRQFSDFWESAVAEQREEPRKTDHLPAVPDRTDPIPTQEIQPLALPQAPVAASPIRQEPEQALAPLPIRSPLLPLDIDSSLDLESYCSVSRRSMQYSWRYLRRPVADGARNVLDLRATVEQVARQRFFLAPVYRRQEVNHAHLMVLVDQGGSMTPFHRFTRDLVETATEERSLPQVSVYYFYNVPTSSIYEDRFLRTPISLETVFSQCDLETSVLIVSDAGAARGHRQPDRFRATTTFLAQLKKSTTLIGWLNPMPADRWEGTTAEMISFVVQMEQMDEDGFSNVIDVIRGQNLFALHSGDG